MTVFDVDAHVEESVDTWRYLPVEYEARRPVPITLDDRPELCGQNSFWLIDGAVVPRVRGKGLTLFGTPTTSRHARAKPFSIPSQELTDPAARVADLDRFGIDTQVVNSTLLNAQLTPDVAYEHALARAFNSWIAEKCRESGGRLRWNAMVRLTDVDSAVAELRRVAGLGAAAAEIHGLAGDQTLEHRRFDPFWAEAERLNMPVYVHIGFETPTLVGLFQTLYMSIAFANRASLLIGFLALVGTGVVERFPRLRLCFAEAGVEWVPWLVHVMDGYWKLGHHAFGDDSGFGHSRTRPSELLRDGNVYVVCEADEDLGAAMAILGEDRIMLGSDMPHSEAHPSSFRQFAARGDVSDRVKAKILGENAERFFAR
ncbi:MAG TPA: amidohydrolase family protein [Chloroflexota bacterium]|nr:amidohydrolase family protein [Chloroflexota bacterium]